MIITALKSDPREEIHYHNIIWQPVLLFQSLHYPWCRFLIFAETCAILQGLLSQEKLHPQQNLPKEIQLGKRKDTANTSSFYFDLLHFIITITNGLRSDVRIFSCELIYFLATQWTLLRPRVVRSLGCVCMQTFHCIKVNMFGKCAL